MFKKVSISLLCVLSIVFAAGCSTASSDDTPSEDSISNEIAQLTVASVAVHQGTTDESNPILYVYLPPSYGTNLDKRYPVAYFLHGFGDSPAEIIQWAGTLDGLFTSDPDHEMIVVSVSGTNSLGGSFYADSPVSGNWETYVIDEAIPLVDATYRTRAEKASRGIFGFSMGGFGAVNLALRNADTFTAIYAYAPGLFDQNGLTDAVQNWQSMQSVMNAYAAAFANEERPAFSGTAEDNAIVAQWENGYGNATGKIAAYLSGTDRLSAIQIDYGTSDEFSWIPRGCRYFLDQFEANGISCASTVTSSNHVFGRTQLSEYAIPFFQASLAF